MARAENTIPIQRPVGEVFQFILDGDNNKLWRSSGTDIKRTTSKPDRVGTKFEQGARGPCGRRIAADYEITECETNRVISFKVTKGPARPLGTYTFESDGAGTRVSFRLHYEPKGFARLMDPMINRTMQAEVGALANLKTYLESKK
jgi:uncharacterized membrane protein